MQMLDRMSMGLVSLPETTYDLVMVLTDADGTRRESQRLLNREVLGLLVMALKPSGSLRSQDGQLGKTTGQERNEAILAGLAYEDGVGFTKPDYSAIQSIPLKLGRRNNGVAQAAGGLTGTNGNSVSLPLNGKRKSEDMTNVKAGATNAPPAGVGFVNSTDDLEPPEDSDDELIDEDTLLDEEDLKRPVKIRKSPDSLCGLPLTMLQPKNALQKPSAGVHAKIALAAWHRSWKRKIRQREPTQTKRLLSYSLEISPRSTLPSRARWEVVVIVHWETLLDVMVALM